MRLIATTDFTFHGIEIRRGQIFDATEEQARDLINQDLAHRFHLEDPGHPPAPPVVEPPPVEPPPEETPAVVSLSPDVAPVSAEGGAGSIAVTIVEPGTWVVDPDVPSWVVVAPTTPQSEDGTVDWSAEANTDVVTRQAVLHINGEPFTLNQAAAAAADTASNGRHKRHSKG